MLSSKLGNLKDLRPFKDIKGYSNNNHLFEDDNKDTLKTKKNCD